VTLPRRTWAATVEKVPLMPLMPLEDSIPDSGLPLGEECQDCQFPWFQCDSLEEYQRNGGHPVYGVNDITYVFNSRGYRCPEFDTYADLRMLSIGCSIAFGIGLPQQALFHELLAQRLRTELQCSVVNWNLSVSGASNDCLSRILHLTVPRLDPHLVVINFTYLGRRECFLVTNERFRYLPADMPLPRIYAEVRQHMQALSSPFDDQAFFFRNYKSIEALLRGRLWLFSCALLKNFDCGSVAAHLDGGHRVDDPGESDSARDGMHPGPKSHQQLYEGYWQKLVATGTLDQLRPMRGSEPRLVVEFSYQQLLYDIRQAVRAVLPRGAKVLVCSKGEEQLLQLDGLCTEHFPGTAAGEYAGCYPNDSSEAIAQLEEARRRGAQYLLLPNTSLWWLSHYTGLQDYLHSTGRLCWLGPPCAIFALERPRRSLLETLRNFWRGGRRAARRR
jgi:hypothetical protein